MHLNQKNKEGRKSVFNVQSTMTGDSKEQRQKERGKKRKSEKRKKKLSIKLLNNNKKPPLTEGEKKCA